MRPSPVSSTLRSPDSTIQAVSRTPENDTAALLEYEMRRCGAEDRSFETIAAFGPNTSVPHHHPDQTGLKKGMPVLLDFGCKVGGYCSDITRTFLFGKGDGAFEEAYAAVLSAHNEALSRVRVGMTGREADELARGCLRKKGFQVWVYSCCGPEYPYVNFSNLEYPFINARQMAWQVYALRADGFLFWHVNNWKRGRRMYIDDTVNFQRFYVRSKFAMNATGDGEFLYPGKNEIFPSIRLANLRDGSEDYDYLVLLSKKKPALALDYSKKICPQRQSPVRDFRRLLEIRRKIAEHLED